jgi:hypothetical protein
MIANVIMANPKTIVDLSEGTVLVTAKEDFNTMAAAYTDEPITTANGIVKFSELLKMVYDSLETGIFDLHEDLILDLKHDIESLKEINEGLTDTLLERGARYGNL